MPTKSSAPERNVRLAEALARDGRYMYIVAGCAEVNPRYLARVIKGTQVASPAVRARLAKELGVPEENIFED